MRKLKNVFKLVISTFGAFLLLWNCQKEEVTETHNEAESHNHSNFKRININDLLQKDDTFSKLSKNYIPSTLLNKSISNKSIKEDLFITSDTINVIEKENYKSYTLRVKRKDFEYDTENLVIEEDNGVKKAYILSYNFDSDWVLDYISGIHTTPKGTVYYSDFDLSNLNSKTTASKSSGTCHYLNITITAPCGCGHYIRSQCSGCRHGNRYPTSYTHRELICGQSSSGGGSETRPGSPLDTDNGFGGPGGGGAPVPKGRNNSDSSANLEDMSEFVEFKVNKLIKNLKLNTNQAKWIGKNIKESLEIYDYVAKAKRWSTEARTGAKMQIVTESTKWDFSKKGTYLNKEALKYKASADVQGTFGTEKMYLLENGLVLYTANGEKKINKDSISLPSSQTSDEGYHYIYSYDTKKYYEYRLPPNNYVHADIDFLLDAFWTGTKIVARYATPIEDAIILIDGKDFDGVKQGKVQTAGFMIVGIIPGGKALKALKPIGKVIKGSGVAKAGWKVIAKVGDETVALSFKVVDGVVSFGSSGSKLAKVIKTTVLEEAHHILPWAERVRLHKVIQDAAYEGFHMNSKVNGKALEKFTKLTGEGIHGNHPAYTDVVENLLNKFKDKYPNFKPKEAKDFLENSLIPRLDNYIERAKNSKLNLNEFFKQVIKAELNII